LGKIFFANSSGLGWWESSELLAKPQFPEVAPLSEPVGRLHACTVASTGQKWVD
jgi:hypothetical protein